MAVSEKERDDLIAAALAARDQAYVPHSNFRVGCAVLFADGAVVQGCNIENASFGATICAERTAISSAIAQGHDDIRAIAVTNDTDTRITPCGICRQFIYEFSSEIEVFCCDRQGNWDRHTITELLPHAFTL